MDEARYRFLEEKLWEIEGGVLAKEHRIKLANTGSHVRVMEPGEGPDVLFVPGAPNASATWAALVNYFDGFLCLILDRLGSGLSDPCHVFHHPKTCSRWETRWSAMSLMV